MSREAKIIECSTDEIAAYIDGELDDGRLREMDLHFAVCRRCSSELNQQKLFLCGLDSTLRYEGEIELPEGFTRRVVANAESTVSGLRRPRELYNALFICSGILLFVLFALGAEAGRVLGSVSTMFDQIGAVGGFFGRIGYSVFLGVAIIVRSFAGQPQVDLVIAAGFFAIFAVFVFYVSRKMTDTRRA